MRDNSERMMSCKNSSVEAVAQEEILNESKNFALKILMLRYSLVFILVGLASGLGSGSFTLLRYRELSTFHGEFNSATIQTTRYLADHLQKIYIASSLVGDIYMTELTNSNSSAELPDYTLPGFQKIVGKINALSKSRATSFAPLITNVTRSSWEKWATENVGSLGGPPSLTTSINGSWTVADGIFTTDSEGKPISSPDHAAGSIYPNLLFPVWQVVPINSNSAAVMYDPHSKYGNRQIAIDRAISTMTGSSTDIVQLVTDKITYRPSTILYFPMIIAANASLPVGLIAIAFTWDELFTDILPSYLNRIDCVISTATVSFTLALENGAVRVVGIGDLHDTDYDEFGATISDGLSGSQAILAGYTITLYPTTSLYSKYITNYPQNVCIGAVTIIVFTALIFTLYVYLVNMREAKLEEVATKSLVRDTSRDAVLQSKKIYVRYISHEMRTPLNVAFLGLKILNKDLAQDPANSDRMETVTDISKACNMALSILNDLLNYDKLEDGTLLIESTRVVALPFILKSTDVLNLQAKEKGLVLTFDLDDDLDLKSHSSKGLTSNMSSSAGSFIGPRSPSQPLGIISCLCDTDYINVDPYKMNQVIGNLISNAIKFTPVGQSVTIKARKVLPDMQYPRFSSSGKGSSFRPLSPLGGHPGKPSYVHKMLTCFSRPCSSTPALDVDVELGGHRDVTGSGSGSGCEGSESRTALNSSGYLVVEVIDSGVGMAPEDSKRLFKEIVQFNPGKLQAGGGSGLGMMIAKGIVDLHGGEISVFSAGEGLGSTFTLKIPLMDTPALSREESVAGEGAFSPSRRTSYTPGHLAFNDGLDGRDPQIRPVTPKSFIKLEQDMRNEEIAMLMESSDPGSFVSITGSSALGTLALPSPILTPRDTDTSALAPVLITAPVTVSVTVHPSVSAPAPVAKDAACLQCEQRKFSILVVDDSKLNRKMLVKSLKAGHHHCYEAEDGMQAVEMVTTKRDCGDGSDVFDAILMDFMMPNMDGPTATKVLRDMGYKGVIIGVTGNALPSDIEHFTIKGADKVLLKPVDVDALLSSLYTLLVPTEAVQ